MLVVSRNHVRSTLQSY